ncbi:MAG TPA: hypothetical protein DD473_24655 [Planctomycetaceae bacterium]|nr:hypothetical protein [Planctomycetaceae bacterium]
MFWQHERPGLVERVEDWQQLLPGVESACSGDGLWQPQGQSGWLAAWEYRGSPMVVIVNQTIKAHFL